MLLLVLGLALATEGNRYLKYMPRIDPACGRDLLAFSDEARSFHLEMKDGEEGAFADWLSDQRRDSAADFVRDATRLWNQAIGIPCSFRSASSHLGTLELQRICQNQLDQQGTQFLGHLANLRVGWAILRASQIWGIATTYYQLEGRAAEIKALAPRLEYLKIAGGAYTPYLKEVYQMGLFDGVQLLRKADARDIWKTCDLDEV